MSVLIEFVEWVKAEAEKSDDLIMEDARTIGKEKSSAVLEAVSDRNNRLTEADSDNSEAAGSPCSVTISRLRVEANDDSPISDASNAYHWDNLKVSALNQFLLLGLRDSITRIPQYQHPFSVLVSF
jgi:hypothetical protein